LFNLGLRHGFILLSFSRLRKENRKFFYPIPLGVESSNAFHFSSGAHFSILTLYGEKTPRQRGGCESALLTPTCR
jgi:hypothetical protein